MCELRRPMIRSISLGGGILFILVTENRPCIAYDWNDNLIARIDPKTGEVVSVECFLDR